MCIWESCHWKDCLPAQKPVRYAYASCERLQVFQSWSCPPWSLHILPSPLLLFCFFGDRSAFLQWPHKRFSKQFIWFYITTSDLTRHVGFTSAIALTMTAGPRSSSFLSLARQTTKSIPVGKHTQKWCSEGIDRLGCAPRQSYIVWPNKMLLFRDSRQHSRQNQARCINIRINSIFGFISGSDGYVGPL